MTVQTDRHPGQVVRSNAASSPVSPEWQLPPAPAWRTFVHRAAEFLFALALLVGAAPLLALAGLLMKLTSRGPIWYSQIRLGRDGRPFRLYKIRTMIHECESLTGARWCIPGDPRITPVGHLLRKTHIDELPQLWNVLRGEMSLIGPRPERPEFIPELEQALPHYRLRLLVRPGLSGLAQVHLPPDTDLESVRRKLACDLYYVRHRGGWLDFRLVLCTALAAVGIPNAPLARLLRIPPREEVERDAALPPLHQNAESPRRAA